MDIYILDILAQNDSLVLVLSDCLTVGIALSLDNARRGADRARGDARCVSLRASPRTCRLTRVSMFVGAAPRARAGPLVSVPASTACKSSPGRRFRFLTLLRRGPPPLSSSSSSSASTPRVILPLPDGSALRLEEHYFDSPVRQPKSDAVGGDRTGLKSWPCALPLLGFLQTRFVEAFGSESLALKGRRVRVLELGSGVGTLGLGIAAVAPNAEVLLTDPDLPLALDEDGDDTTTLEWLRRNVERNRDVVGERAEALPLLWGDEAHMLAIEDHPRWGAEGRGMRADPHRSSSCVRRKLTTGRRLALVPGSLPRGFDFIVGADLLYNPDAYDALWRTLKRLSRDGGAKEKDERIIESEERMTPTTVVLGYPMRMGVEKKFIVAAETHGFEEVTSETLPLGEGKVGHAVVSVLRPRAASHLEPSYE